MRFLIAIRQLKDLLLVHRKVFNDVLVPQLGSGFVSLSLVPDDSKHPRVGASPIVGPVGNIPQSFVESVPILGCYLLI